MLASTLVMAAQVVQRTCDLRSLPLLLRGTPRRAVPKDVVTPAEWDAELAVAAEEIGAGQPPR